MTSSINLIKRNLTKISALKFIFMGLIFSFNAYAENSEKIISGNGVELDIKKDDFAKRIEITGPLIKFITSDGKEMENYGHVTGIYSPGKNINTSVQGYLFTYGETSPFNNLMPILKGGEVLNVFITGRVTIACSSICKYAYHFVMDVPIEKVKKYSEDGVVSIQFRNKSQIWRPVIKIPTDHFTAVYNYK